MFSQEVIERLNLKSDAHEGWFDSNDILQELVLNSHIIIQPSLMASVRQIFASDTDYGRIIAFEKHDFKWSYLLNLVEKYAVIDSIEGLLDQVDVLGGHCCVENDFLALELPVGYILDITLAEQVRFDVRQISGMALDQQLG